MSLVVKGSYASLPRLPSVPEILSLEDWTHIPRPRRKDPDAPIVLVTLRFPRAQALSRSRTLPDPDQQARLLTMNLHTCSSISRGRARRSGRASLLAGTGHAWRPPGEQASSPARATPGRERILPTARATQCPPSRASSSPHRLGTEEDGRRWRRRGRRL